MTSEEHEQAVAAVEMLKNKQVEIRGRIQANTAAARALNEENRKLIEQVRVLKEEEQAIDVELHRHAQEENQRKLELANEEQRKKQVANQKKREAQKDVANVD